MPKHHKITLSDGTQVTAEELLEEEKNIFLTDVFVDIVRVNVSLSYGADGELLYLIGTLPAKELKRAYKKRWPIEVFFQALKARGFNMEDSCLRDLEKYKKLFAIVSIAYTICWATRIEDGRKNPVKVKKHGYPQYSIFRRGLNLMRQFYKNQILQPIQKALDRAYLKMKVHLKTIG